MINHPHRIEHAAMLGIWLSAVVISGIGPTDRLTWFFEVLPVLVVIPLMTQTYLTFPLTPLLYRLAFIHGLILILGAHYTYAEVPLGFWLQDAFNLSRNPYDRIGHFAQGFVPAILAREILLRKTSLRAGRMLFFLVLCVCLAFSAFYELLEWWAAVALGAEADAFLGTQGDPWDTQWDMFLALSGAATAQILLGRRHDRQITAL